MKSERWMIAVQCDYTKARFEITFVCRFTRRKRAHIYKKRNFSDDTSMGIRKNLFLITIRYVMQLVVNSN